MKRRSWISAAVLLIAGCSQNGRSVDPTSEGSGVQDAFAWMAAGQKAGGKLAAGVGEATWAEVSARLEAEAAAAARLEAEAAAAARLEAEAAAAARAQARAKAVAAARAPAKAVAAARAPAKAVAAARAPAKVRGVARVPAKMSGAAWPKAAVRAARMGLGVGPVDGFGSFVGIDDLTNESQLCQKWLDLCLHAPTQVERADRCETYKRQCLGLVGSPVLADSQASVLGERVNVSRFSRPIPDETPYLRAEVNDRLVQRVFDQANFTPTGVKRFLPESNPWKAIVVHDPPGWLPGSGAPTGASPGALGVPPHDTSVGVPTGVQIGAPFGAPFEAPLGAPFGLPSMAALEPLTLVPQMQPMMTVRVTAWH